MIRHLILAVGLTLAAVPALVGPVRAQGPTAQPAPPTQPAPASAKQAPQAGALGLPPTVTLTQPELRALVTVEIATARAQELQASAKPVYEKIEAAFAPPKPQAPAAPKPAK